VNEQTIDSITITNTKLLAELHGLSAGVSGQNQIAQQQRVNDTANAVHANTLSAAQQMAQLAGMQALQISQNGAMLAQAMTGRVARHILDLSAEQAVAFSKEIAADLAGKMEEFGATLSSIEQFAKVANSTPRETGLPVEETLIRVNAALESILARLPVK
jgi:hypothetical protein